MKKLFFVIALAIATVASAEDLEKLRRDQSHSYFDPEAHLRLAKYLDDHGERLTAFSIIEEVKRLFNEEEFVAAFAKVFPGEEGDTEVQTNATEHVEAATAAMQAGDDVKAGKEFARAVEIAPRISQLQMLTGRFFGSIEKPADALKFYLNSYFLNPGDASVVAEIQSVAGEIYGKKFTAERTKGVMLAKLLSDREMPIREAALSAADAKWSAEYTDPVIELLSDDDPDIRLYAGKVLGAHLTDDARLSQLLMSENPRVRAYALFAAGIHWKDKAVPQIARLVVSKDDVEALAAVIVLARYSGDKGKEVLHNIRDSGAMKGTRLEPVVNSLAR